MRDYRWGIIGTGHIAAKFLQGLSVVPQAIPYAAASRSKEKADAFAAEHDIATAYASYDELLNDPSVDIVYIATPNHLHFPLTMHSMQKGKAVLCEKPLGLSTTEVAEMVETSEKKNIFMMEALWTAFLPSISTVLRLIGKGVIGEVQVLKADFGIHPNYQPESRLFNPQLGGGSVYDIGIYPLFLALRVLGMPTDVSSVSSPAPTGVDMTTAIVMNHDGGKISSLTSSFACRLKSEAYIYGSKGYLHLEEMFHTPTRLYIRKENDEKEIEIPLSYEGNGYNYEALEVMRCVDNGRNESDIFPHSFSIGLSKIISTVLHQSK